MKFSDSNNPTDLTLPPFLGENAAALLDLRAQMAWTTLVGLPTLLVGLPTTPVQVS